MNKKLLFGMFATSALVLTTSCSNDEIFEPSSGDNATVTFSLKAPGTALTRAAMGGGNGNLANTLVVAVYDSNGNIITDLCKKETASDLISGHEVNLSLAKGQEYTVAFWAQSSDCSAYSISEDYDLKNITINYAGVNNDVNRDAFCKAVNFTVNGNMTENVVLTRPFAQVNVGASDYTEAQTAGVTITNSTSTIKNAATALNVVSGEATGSADVTFTSAAIPTGNLTVESADYKWLSMCYVLPQGNTESTTVETSFSFTNVDSSRTIELSEGLQSTPIQRNYRTNIIGRLLTSTAQFVVKVDNNFQDDITVTTPSELELAASNGGNYTLTGDVVLDGPLVVKADLQLNLNGHKIVSKEGDYFTPGNGRHTAMISAQNGATVTISGDGEINGVPGKIYAIETRGGNIIVNGNGKYIGETTAAYALNGNITINGGEYSQTGWENDNYVLNIKDNSGSTITVNGGKIYKYNPASTPSENPAINLVGTGYKAIQYGDWYYVVENRVDRLIGTPAELVAFANSVNVEHKEYNGGKDKILLINDIDMTGITMEPIGNEFVDTRYIFYGIFDGQGHTISNLTITAAANAYEFYATGLFGWLNGSVQNLTIDNATINGHHHVGAIAGYVQYFGDHNGIIKNCTVKNSKIHATYENDDNDGGKAGALSGTSYGRYYNCHAINCQVDATKDAGWLLGASRSEYINADCSATNVTVTLNNSDLIDGLHKTGSYGRAINNEGFVGLTIE